MFLVFVGGFVGVFRSLRGFCRGLRGFLSGFAGFCRVFSELSFVGDSVLPLGFDFFGVS